jgi:hypothetical protein
MNYNDVSIPYRIVVRSEKSIDLRFKLTFTAPHPNDAPTIILKFPHSF